MVDATDVGILQNTLEYAGSNEKQWKRWSDNGIKGINQHFSWNSHVRKYLSLMNKQFNLTESQSLAEVIPLSGIKAS